MLKVDDLTSRYGPIVAVRGLSLRVEQSEIVALLGPNGAGKSTTLLSIMGIVKPASGRIVLGGIDITGRDPEEVVRLGATLTPEGRRVFAGLTVQENLLLGGVTRRDRAEARRDFDQMLDLFPILQERLSQLGGTLSGGEQQQLAVARSLMSSPKVLLLDEPSLGLAPLFVSLIFDLIKRLRAERGLSVLLVEQNVDRALRISDRAYVLSNGQLLLSGSSVDVLKSNIEAAYLGIGAPN